MLRNVEVLLAFKAVYCLSYEKSALLGIPVF